MLHARVRIIDAAVNPSSTPSVRRYYLDWIRVGAFALLMMVVVLYAGVGYLNFTAFEMGAAVIVFVWLLLFIRTVTAAVEGSARTTSDADGA